MTSSVLLDESHADEAPHGEAFATGGGGRTRSTAATGGKLRYEPGLDGLRGLALLAIVVYHAELSFAPGAFLSVSTFFTLSGFLITALAIGEIDSRGTFSLRSFWSRRFRRLLPAAVCAIGAIVLFSFAFADSTQRARIPGDALASLFYVANWRFILSGASYGAMFQSPSPFTHFWTLSVEEQFYLVFPLILAAVFVVARGSRKVLAAVFGLLVVASTVWSAVLVNGGAAIDRVYFGTDTRLAEFLAGSLFAVWWMRPNRPPLRRAAVYVGAVALVLMLVLWTVSEQTERFWYAGGLTLYACVTLGVVLGALHPRGPVRRILGVRPLVWVGTVSYAAYLIHWPVLLWLDRIGRLQPVARFVVGLAITLLLAGLFTRLVERPIRQGTRLTGRRGAVAVPFAFLTVIALIAASAMSAPPDRTTVDFAAAQARADAMGSGEPPPSGSDFDRYVRYRTLLDASTAPRVAFFGDSTALMSGLGFDHWTTEDDYRTLAPQNGSTHLGCGLLTGVGQINEGEKQQVSSECDGYPDRWRAALTDDETDKPTDIAVVQVGPWDVLDQQLIPDGPWLTIGEDAELDQALEAKLASLVAMLQEHVELVVLVAPPDIMPGMVDGRPPTVPYAESDPARMERFREIVRDVAEATPHVEVADLQDFLQRQPDQWQLRPDGVHPTSETANAVGDWLGPEIKRLWDLDRSAREPSD